MKITNVDTFTIELEKPSAENHTHYWGNLRYRTLDLTRIQTDENVTGYGFRLTDEKMLKQRVLSRLIGSNPLDIVFHLASGALAGCPAVEHALWDIAGKVANLPVRSLLGSARTTIPYYLTCVWPGKIDQSHLDIREQAEQIVRYYEMGHTRFKIRGWRPKPLDDVKVFEIVRRMVGGRDKIELMLDRTAHKSGWLWSYEQALEVARSLEAVDATWLEEPFARDDLASYRRLADEVDIPITGGEFALEIGTFREYLISGAVDIIQPDGVLSGGIWPCREAGVLADAFGKPCILHGTNGPDLAAYLQIAASIASCRMMEVALIFPPLTPEQMWEPLNRVLKSPGPLFQLKDGLLKLPEGPGLGIELDEEMVEALRI